MKISYKNISIFLLFLFSLNFINMESRILLLTFVALMLITPRWKLPITTTGFILALFSISYYLFAAIYNSSMMTYYIIPLLVGPFIGYSIGVILLDNSYQDYSKGLKIIIYTIVFGRFIHGLLNFISSSGYTGYIRNGLDFWTNSIIAATVQGTLMTMAISLLFYSVFVVKKSNIFEKAATLLCVIVSLVNSLLSASRTAMIIMVLVFILCAITYIFISNEEKSKKRKLIVGMVVLGLLFFWVYQSNTFGVKSYWESSPLFERINNASYYEEGDKNRMDMLAVTISGALNSPLGNGDMSSTAHNLWLDVLRQTGWIPFVLLVIFSVMTIIKMIRIIRSEGVPTDIKFLLFSVLTGTLLNFAVEPIFKGMPYFFVSFCVIAGAMERYSNYMNGPVLENGDVQHDHH